MKDGRHAARSALEAKAREYAHSRSSVRLRRSTLLFCHGQWGRIRMWRALRSAMTALKAADIEAPIYISVQWDERNARLHPEWRVLSAGNAFQHALPKDPSSAKQLSPAWHTLCLNHEAYRRELLEQAREVLSLTRRGHRRDAARRHVRKRFPAREDSGTGEQDRAYRAFRDLRHDDSPFSLRNLNPAAPRCPPGGCREKFSVNMSPV